MSSENGENKKARVGVPDVPISLHEEDVAGLNVGDYAEALTEFIKQTDTPMTVGIQGDWGSGKTSIMNLIRQRLNDQYATVWINTWKYAQTDPGQSLATAVFLAIIHRLSKEYEIRGSKEKRAEFMGKMGKALGNIVGRATEAHIGVNIKEAFESGRADEVFERFEAIEQLKEQLTGLVDGIVKSKSEKAPGDRVVLFVDDLDRVPPERAVEILEVLKVFLDIAGLVFVLACDYEVILQGLRSKGTLGGEEVSGRSFFDKIIQVPFQMPRPDGAKLETYLRTLLSRVDAGQLGKDDIVSMITVLEHTAGSNPRTIKRILNIVNLLMLILNSQKCTWDDMILNKAAVVFSLVALQNAYPDVYASLSRRKQDKVFSDFTEEAFDEDQYLRRARQKHPDLDVTRLNIVLEQLSALLGGRAEDMINFLKLSDVATIQEKQTECEVPTSRIVAAFIRRLDPWQREIVDAVLAAVPDAATSGIRGQPAIRIVAPEDRSFQVSIRGEAGDDELLVLFGYFEKVSEADEYVELLAAHGVPASRTSGAGSQRLIQQGYRIMTKVSESDRDVDAMLKGIEWYLMKAPLEE